MRPVRLVSTIVLAAALALSLTACGGNWFEDAAGAARAAAHDATDLEHSHWTPPHYVPPVIPPTADQVVRAEQAIAQPAKGLSLDDAKELIEGACEAVEAVELEGGTEEDAVDYLVEHTGGEYARRTEGEELVRNLAEANNPAQQAYILGRAALCEWASSSSD